MLIDLLPLFFWSATQGGLLLGGVAGPPSPPSLLVKVAKRICSFGYGLSSSPPPSSSLLRAGGSSSHGGKEVGSSKEVGPRRRLVQGRRLVKGRRKEEVALLVRGCKEGMQGGLGGFDSWRIVAHTTFKRRWVIL